MTMLMMALPCASLSLSLSCVLSHSLYRSRFASAGSLPLLDDRPAAPSFGTRRSVVTSLIDFLREKKRRCKLGEPSMALRTCVGLATGDDGPDAGDDDPEDADDDDDDDDNDDGANTDGDDDDDATAPAPNAAAAAAAVACSALTERVRFRFGFVISRSSVRLNGLASCVRVCARSVLTAFSGDDERSVLLGGDAGRPTAFVVAVVVALVLVCEMRIVVPPAVDSDDAVVVVVWHTSKHASTPRICHGSITRGASERERAYFVRPIGGS